MPIFTYIVVKADGSDGETLEIEQNLNDAPLERHPITGEKLRRVFSAVGLVTRYAENEMKRATTDEKLFSERGFTKYERDPATGIYHKTAGTDASAPETFRKPDGNELLPHEDRLLHGENCHCAHCRGKRK